MKLIIYTAKKNKTLKSMVLVSFFLVFFKEINIFLFCKDAFNWLKATDQNKLIMLENISFELFISKSWKKNSFTVSTDIF